MDPARHRSGPDRRGRRHRRARRLRARPVPAGADRPGRGHQDLVLTGIRVAGTDIDIGCGLDADLERLRVIDIDIDTNVEFGIDTNVEFDIDIDSHSHRAGGLELGPRDLARHGVDLDRWDVVTSVLLDPPLSAGAAADRAVTSTRGRWVTWWPWLMAAVVTAAYAVLSVERYRHGDFSSWDLAIFTQAEQQWSHGHLPTSTVRGGPGFDLLGDHFSPALALLAPGYRLFPSPVFLLLAQSALFGISVVPIARLAARRLGHPAAVLLTFAYGVSWGLQQAVVVDFHEIALAVPLIAAGACSLVEHRWRAAAVWLLPLVLVKEDLGLTVAVAGVYAFFHGARRLGLALGIVGAGATVLELAVVIPAFSGNHHNAYVTTVRGHTVHGVFEALVWPEPKPTTLFLIAGATAFVCLRSPISTLCIPTLVWRFESDDTTYWGHLWHYNAVLMPIVFVATIDALLRLRRGRWRAGAAAAAYVPAIVATIAVMSLNTGPLGALRSAATYRHTALEATIARVETLVPASASVETDIGLMSHLTADRRTYFVGNNTGSLVPRYLVTDQSAWSVPMQGADTVKYALTLHPGARYRIVLNDDGITVLRLDTG